MLRESITHPINWLGYTMSMMREKQIEACEKRLSSHPRIALFSDNATELDAQGLFEHSYDRYEWCDTRTLVTLSFLRERVRERLPLEAMTLTPAEISLVERLLMADGKLTLEQIDEIAAAEALICRLWCGYTQSGDEITLELPLSLHHTIIEAMQSDECVRLRDRLTRFDATIAGLLYIAGFLHSAQPVETFASEVLGRGDELAHDLAMRYLKSAYDYILDNNQALILLHPGLADPYRLIAKTRSGGVFTLELTQDMLLGGISGILPQEQPLHDALMGALQGAVRPDWDAGEAADDLRMLCKQGVSLETLESVMESMLMVMPTQEMKSAVRQLYWFTPHWLGMEANCKH